MTISQALNMSPSLADFLCDFWGIDYCDPEAWTHPTSTFGIAGVKLGEKRMTLWEETKPTSENRGRKYGTDHGQVEELADDIEQNGIDTKCAVGYVDAETGERIGTNHRYHASQRLGIPGWMLQHVDFSECDDPEWARELFARAINNERTLRQNNNTPEDVEQCIIYGIEKGNITTDKQVEDIIKMLSNNSFSKYKQTTLINAMSIRLHRGGAAKSGLKRYVLVDNKQFNILVEKLSEEDDYYVKNIVENEHEAFLFINMRNWGSRQSSLISHGARVTTGNHPLHLAFSVDKPSRHESLQSKRDKVMDTHMVNVEQDLLDIMTYKMKYGYFPWRHPDCQHMFVAQDTHKEKVDSLIPMTQD